MLFVPTSTVPTPLESDWELDAHYLYYHHGPLARTELGEHTVQGIDYAYTLQGWLKGVNSESLYADRDMGKDGNNAVGNSNQFFAKDAFGFSLGYHNSDYTPIDASATFLADKTGSNLLASTTNLYNGNISSMVTTIVPPTLLPPSGGGGASYAPAPQGTVYRYDRLNRLKSSNAWQNLNTVNNTWESGLAYAGMYENNFNYDANGNILTQGRKDATGTYIDTLTYQYAVNTNGRKVQNRLYHVNDPYNYNTEDIDDMGTFNDNVETINNGSNNYQYDEIGNLIQDNQEEIEEIKWRVDGKIAEIKRGSGSSKQNLVFNYDPQGNRIAKHLYLYSNSNQYLWEKSTYYVRDAQGNPMAVYDLIASGSSGLSYKVAERDIYGSSRIGLNTTPVEMIGATPPTDIYAHILGDRQYELNNHLGNVHVVVSDRKLTVDDGVYDINGSQTSTTPDGIIDYFTADVLSATDYGPFHSIMPGRSFNSSEYRYGGAGGQEKDDEITGVTGSHYTAEFWEYDSRLGRRWNTDPVVYAWQSSYAAFNNNPIYFADPSGAVAQEAGGDDDPVVNPNNPVQVSTFEFIEKKSFWSKIGDFFKQIGNSLRDYDNNTVDKDDDFVKPIKTGLGGERPVGGGRQTNQGFLGDPSRDDKTGITPGATLGGLSPTPTRGLANTFYELSQGFDAVVEQINAFLSGGDDESVEENTQKTHVNAHKIPDTDTIVTAIDRIIKRDVEGKMNGWEDSYTTDTIKKKNYDGKIKVKTVR